MAELDRIRGLHHYAFRCRNAEETRSFYEDLLGLPLAHVIKADTVPSTGASDPYVHLFFEFADGSYIAFFDLGDEKPFTLDPETPSWVNHFAMRVDTVEEMERWKQRLDAAGIEVIGPTDHGFVQSIYFFDPNNMRLEITCEVTGEDYRRQCREKAHADLREWTDNRPPPLNRYSPKLEQLVNA